MGVLDEKKFEGRWFGDGSNWKENVVRGLEYK